MSTSNFDYSLLGNSTMSKDRESEIVNKIIESLSK